MTNPTMAQLAYINDLYNKLDVRYPLREKPEDTIAASALIRKLKDELALKQSVEGDCNELEDF